MKQAKLAVVTRTQDRPLFLARALESLAAQTQRDFIWVIVNDAGPANAVDRIAEQAVGRGLATTVVHRATSTGMEAASNAGVRAAASEFIALHDDDDTWRPQFVETMLAHMAARPAEIGVVCWTDEQREQVREGRIQARSLRSGLYCPDAITLARLATRNQFPPIAFLYRRALFDKLNGYDESLPVLGDWDFNLRAGLQGDIGVVRLPLARYHTRIGASGAAANSVTARLALHEETDALLRNRWLRDDIEKGRPGLGALMAHAQQTERAANAAAERASLLLRLRRKLRRWRL